MEFICKTSLEETNNWPIFYSSFFLGSAVPQQIPGAVPIPSGQDNLNRNEALEILQSSREVQVFLRDIK